MMMIVGVEDGDDFGDDYSDNENDDDIDDIEIMWITLMIWEIRAPF